MSRPTSVYIIVAGEFVKIGVAVDPAKRLKGINTGTPVKAELYRSREFDHPLVARHIESWMHRCLANHRANGEWFRLSPEVAWTRLKKMRAPKLKDPTKRHDTIERWDFSDDDPRITDILMNPALGHSG